MRLIEYVATDALVRCVVLNVFNVGRQVAACGARCTSGWNRANWKRNSAIFLYVIMFMLYLNVKYALQITGYGYKNYIKIWT